MVKYYPSDFTRTRARIDVQVRAMMTMMGEVLPSPPSPISTPPTTPKESADMIEVGKVILVEESKGEYSKRAEQSLAVRMSEQAISIDISKYRDQRESIYTYEPVTMSPEKTIELAQMLLKAAELQPEYAEEAKRLREELDNLATKYKDMISGLGLEHEVDVLDDRGTFTVVDSAGKALT